MKRKLDKQKWINTLTQNEESGYLIYNRKSTDEPDNQKNSIQYQIDENTAYASKNNLPLSNLTIEGFCTEGVINERHSAYKENELFEIDNDGNMKYRIERPKFAKLVQLMHQGKIKGVIVLCWDRISRNKSDETIIRRLMNLGVDFRFTLTSYEDSSSGALHMDIDGMFAIHHSRVTSEKVRIAVRNKKEKGCVMNLAPVGYLNLGMAEDKPFDPVRAPIIKEIFTMYASGMYSVFEITEYVNSLGIMMPKRRAVRTKQELLSCSVEEFDRPKFERPFQKATIHRVLKNRFYTGMIKGNDGIWIPSTSHQPLVDIDTFNHVQKLLSGRNQSVKHQSSLTYPLRGFIRCTGCNRIYTPYLKKGIQYYYSRCSKTCTNSTQSISLNKIIESSKLILDRMESLSDDFLKEISSIDKGDLELRMENQGKEMERIRLQLSKYTEDLRYITSHKIELLRTEVYSPTSWFDEQQRLQMEISIAEFNLKETSENNEFDTISELEEIKVILKSIVEKINSSETSIKERILNLLCSELHYFQNNLTFKLRKEFDFLSLPEVSSCAPNVIQPELPTLYHRINECLIGLKEIDLDFLGFP